MTPYLAWVDEGALAAARPAEGNKRVLGAPNAEGGEPSVSEFGKPYLGRLDRGVRLAPLGAQGGADG